MLIPAAAAVIYISLGIKVPDTRKGFSIDLPWPVETGQLGHPMRPRIAVLVTVLVIATGLGVSGCANMTTTEQRTLSGAAIGALGGAAIAAIAEGGVATGAAIGAGVGAGAGYLYSLSRDEHRAAYHPTKQTAARAVKKPKPQSPVRPSDEQVQVAANQ